MTKFVVLWISAILLVSLGQLSPTSASDHVASPTMSQPSDDVATPDVQPGAPATDEQCGAVPLEPMSSPPPVTQLTCPKGTAFTCCRCGGCGCRPQNISPTNWCAC